MKYRIKAKNQYSKRDAIIELWVSNELGCGRILDKVFYNNDECSDKDDKPTFPSFCNYDCGNDCWKKPYGLTIIPYFFGLKVCIRSEEANPYFAK